ncbi:MAG: sigma-70 family RNA polymerase sigma factor [Archangium sp.]
MDPLASQFETHRAHLRSVAYRMLGSRSEADDAVQEAWLRLSQSDASAVENLQSWLTTIVARVCLDQLRVRKSRSAPLPDEASPLGEVTAPDANALLADSIGPALIVVLDSLAPVERLAFVLHDLFAVSFDEIAGVINKTPAAARQIASRARRRVQGREEPLSADAQRRQQIVAAFLAASRGGNFEALLEVLDPNASVRADATASALGQLSPMAGAAEVAKFFSTRARGAHAYSFDGVPNAAWAPGGTVKVAFFITIGANGKISEVELVADADRLAPMDLEPTEVSPTSTSAAPSTSSLPTAR